MEEKELKFNFKITSKLVFHFCYRLKIFPVTPLTGIILISFDLTSRNLFSVCHFRKDFINLIYIPAPFDGLPGRLIFRKISLKAYCWIYHTPYRHSSLKSIPAAYIASDTFYRTFTSCNLVRPFRVGEKPPAYTY